MTGVSYASPTYYADRLCERGRLYIRRFYNGDDAPLAEELRRVRAHALEARRGRGREADLGVDAEVRRVVEGRVRGEFYRGREGNPWVAGVGETMFWM